MPNNTFANPQCLLCYLLVLTELQKEKTHRAPKSKKLTELQNAKKRSQNSKKKKLTELKKTKIPQRSKTQLSLRYVFHQRFPNCTNLCLIHGSKMTIGEIQHICVWCWFLLISLGYICHKLPEIADFNTARKKTLKWSFVDFAWSGAPVCYALAGSHRAVFVAYILYPRPKNLREISKIISVNQ